jgi:hypothetical protein
LFTWQLQIASLSYNQTTDDWFWQIGSLFAALIGIAILFVRKPDGMWNGIILLTLGFLGHVGHLLFTIEGNYSGIVRLAYMAAYPILLTLPQRFSSVPSTIDAPVRVTTQNEDASLLERRRYSTDPKTFHAMLALAAESNPTKVSQAITRAIAQTMLSDLCFMIYLTDHKIKSAAGYGWIREDTRMAVHSKTSIPIWRTHYARAHTDAHPAVPADIKARRYHQPDQPRSLIAAHHPPERVAGGSFAPIFRPHMDWKTRLTLEYRNIISANHQAEPEDK